MIVVASRSRGRDVVGATQWTKGRKVVVPLMKRKVVVLLMKRKVVVVVVTWRRGKGMKVATQEWEG